MNMTLKKSKPKPKPVPFPNTLARSKKMIMPITIFTKGTNMSNNHHHGRPIISSSVSTLYMGTIEAHPGFPAFTKTFHKQTIEKTLTKKMKR